jgi:hypothetical protein
MTKVINEVVGVLNAVTVYPIELRFPWKYFPWDKITGEYDTSYVGVTVANADYIKVTWDDEPSESENQITNLDSLAWKNFLNTTLDITDKNKKAEFLKEAKKHVGEIVKVRFIGRDRPISDSVIEAISHKSRLPKRWNTLVEISYQNNQQA